MSAIQATFVRIQTMADGSPRLILDLNCSLSEIAALNLVPGAPFGLVRMNPGIHTPEPEKEPEKPKGGPLARLAGIWCNDIEFRSWMGLHFKTVSPLTEDSAAELMRDICGTNSRAELDNDADATYRFNLEIREPYMRYMKNKC